MSSTDNFSNQFGPRQGLIKSQAWSESKLFDTLMVFQKDFFEKVDFDFEKKQQQIWQESMKDYPTSKELLGQDSWKTGIMKEPS